MNALEALAKLTQCGDSNVSDFDDGDGPEGCGWFGWSVDSASPETPILTVTWESDFDGLGKQKFSWMLTPVGSSGGTAEVSGA